MKALELTAMQMLSKDKEKFVCHSSWLMLRINSTFLTAHSSFIL